MNEELEDVTMFLDKYVNDNALTAAAVYTGEGHLVAGSEKWSSYGSEEGAGRIIESIFGEFTPSIEWGEIVEKGKKFRANFVVIRREQEHEIMCKIKPTHWTHCRYSLSAIVLKNGAVLFLLADALLERTIYLNHVIYLNICSWASKPNQPGILLPLLNFLRKCQIATGNL